MKIWILQRKQPVFYNVTLFRLCGIFIFIFTFFNLSCISKSDTIVHSSVGKKQLSSLNRIIKDIRLSPINGPEFLLSKFKKKKAIVIAMREKGCPIAEKYGPRLFRLEKKYSKQGVQFIYNYVGQVKTEENAKKDLKNQGFRGPYVIDSEQMVINALSARTTGDIFILTPERRVIYRGPVDDQYHLLKSAIKPKNHYLAEILEAIIIPGKNITPKELPAPGCIISLKK